MPMNGRKISSLLSPSFHRYYCVSFVTHVSRRHFTRSNRAFDLANPREVVMTAKEWPPVPYLEDFDRLGEQIFLSKNPLDLSKEAPSGCPGIIVLCTWLYAQPKYVSKYTAAYRKMYPQTAILLLKQDGPDMMWRPNAWQMDNMKPAVDILRGETTGRLPRPIHMHVFSNGGAFTACRLAEAIDLAEKSSLGNDGGSNSSMKDFTLQISTLVIDSAPSIPSLARGRVALTQGMPASLPGPVRAVGGLILYSSMISLSLVSRMLGSEGVLTGTRRKLNDTDGPFIAAGIKRIYIYSESDELVPYQEVEEHAHEARDIYDNQFGGSGHDQVQFEKFEGSKHVAHAVKDPDRYWSIIKKLWPAGSDKS